MVLREVIQYCCTQMRYWSVDVDSYYGHCRNKEANVLHSSAYPKFS